MEVGCDRKSGEHARVHVREKSSRGPCAIRLTPGHETKVWLKLGRNVRDIRERRSHLLSRSRISHSASKTRVNALTTTASPSMRWLSLCLSPKARADGRKRPYVGRGHNNNRPNLCDSQCGLRADSSNGISVCCEGKARASPPQPTFNGQLVHGQDRGRLAGLGSMCEPLAKAQHPLLSNANHGSHLPPSWRTLYEISKLSPEVLDAKAKRLRVLEWTEQPR